MHVADAGGGNLAGDEFCYRQVEALEHEECRQGDEEGCDAGAGHQVAVECTDTEGDDEG